MKRALIAIFTCAAAAGALLLPAGSLATLSELGASPSVTGTPPTPPSCPANPCLAVSRTTGFQAKAGTVKSPLGVPRPGKVVAWTITLAKPTAKQIQYFNTNEGGPASAQISVLRPGRKLGFKLIASSPPVQLQDYFGKTVQFPLDTTLTVAKGDVVALTVPTWAPALAVGFANTTSWRASRSRKKCGDTTTQTSQTTVGANMQYFCLYKGARLTYTATLISTP